MTIICDKLRLDIVMKLMRPVFTNKSVEFSIKPSGSPNKSVEFSIKPSGSPQFTDQSA